MEGQDSEREEGKCFVNSPASARDSRVETGVTAANDGGNDDLVPLDGDRHDIDH